MLSVYMDEAGTDVGSSVLTVGAYLARPKEWRAFKPRWNAAKSPLKVYHASDAQNLRGEFKGWDKTARDKLVARLLPIIPAHEIAGICIGIHMDAFNEAIAPHPDLKKLFGRPYTACFHWVVQRTLQYQHEAGNKARIAFFHEVNDYQGEATQSFNWVREHANPNKIRMTLEFRRKEDCLQLQAADILAYEGNKRMRDQSRPERRSYKALSPDTPPAHRIGHVSASKRRRRRTTPKR